MKLRTFVIGAVALAAIGGAVWVSIQPEVIPVDMTTVGSGPMEVTVNADGRTEVRDVVGGPSGGGVGPRGSGHHRDIVRA